MLAVAPDTDLRRPPGRPPGRPPSPSPGRSPGRTSGRPPGRPPADAAPVSRDEILLAALQAFATHGYEGTSVRELCGTLGVSHNLLNQRFGTKRHLWDATMDRWFADLVAGLTAVLDDPGPGGERVDAADRLRTFIVRFVHLAARRPELLRVMAHEAGIESDRLDHVWRAFVTPIADRVAVLHAEAVAAGRVRELPVGTLFALLAHGGTALVANPPLARRLGIPDPASPAVLARHAEAVADLLLGRSGATERGARP